MAFDVVYREKQPCRCERPTTGFNMNDVIQCIDCKEYWQCKGLSDGGMQWDPSPRVLTWKKVTPKLGFRNDIEGWD